MGSISKEPDGRFRASVRKKGYCLRARFSDKRTAELWVRYKEDLIDKMSAFEVPMKDTMTLLDASVLKISEMKDKDLDKRSIKDVEMVMRNDFSHFQEYSLSDLSYELLLNTAKQMLSAKVRIGGGKNPDSGREVIQSPISVLKKFRILGSVISHANTIGANIDNPVPRLTSYLHNQLSI